MLTSATTGILARERRRLTGLVFNRNLLDDRARIVIRKLELSGLLFVLLVSRNFGRRRGGGVKRDSTRRDGKSSADEDGTPVLGNERLYTVDEAWS